LWNLFSHNFRIPLVPDSVIPPNLGGRALYCGDKPVTLALRRLLKTPEWKTARHFVYWQAKPVTGATRKRGFPPQPTTPVTGSNEAGRQKRRRAQRRSPGGRANVKKSGKSAHFNPENLQRFSVVGFFNSFLGREIQQSLDQITISHGGTDDHKRDKSENSPVEELGRPFGEAVHRFASHFGIVAAPFGEFAVELA